MVSIGQYLGCLKGYYGGAILYYPILYSTLLDSTIPYYTIPERLGLPLRVGSQPCRLPHLQAGPLRRRAVRRLLESTSVGAQNYVCVYTIHIYLCMYVCMYVCMYILIYIYGC